MTLENWNDILMSCLRTDVNVALSMLYCINFYILTFDIFMTKKKKNITKVVSWIFMGNYVLLNLFLAILLDNFGNDDINEIE
jgi:hypothetical protein